MKVNFNSCELFKTEFDYFVLNLYFLRKKIIKLKIEEYC